MRPEKKAKKAGGGLSKLGGGAAAASTAAEESKGGDNSALKAQIDSLNAEIAQLKAAGSGGATAAAEPTEDLTTKPELGYWKIRGLGQALRVQLAYCGVDFTDKMYEVNQLEDGGWDTSDWTSVKPTLGMPYPNLPYIIDGETKLSETMAIHKYIAMKWKPELMGKGAAEKARVEMLAANFYPIKEKSTVPMYFGEHEGDALKDHIVETIQPMMQAFVDATSGSTWVAGENMTWLDFFYAEFLEFIDVSLDGRFAAEFPSLKEYLERFKSLPAVQEFYGREDTIHSAFNNKMAKLANY